MVSIGVLLLGFLLGVVSSVFLIVLALWKVSKVVSMDPRERNLSDKEQIERESERSGEPNGYRNLKAAEFFEKQELGLNATYSGWLTVTPDYYKFPQINADEFTKKVDNDDTNLAGVSNIFKAKKGKQNQESEDPSTKTANQLTKIRKKYRFFAVLKHGNLFLYTDESKTNSKAVIVLSKHLVTMWPRTLADSQLFTKSSAICLLNIDKLAPVEIESYLFESNETTIPPENSYFLYSDTHSEKEDIYLALLRASKGHEGKPSFNEKDLFDPSFVAKTLHFSTADINSLIQTLNSTEGQLTTKWLNAFIGRYFLAVYHTPEFEAKCVEFIEKKLKKIRMPGFLDNLQIQRIHVGHGAPFITNPRLEKLSPEGDLDIIANILYQGGCVIEVSTKLFLNITGFKQREFDVILKITVKRINGDLLFRIKKQPSNRLWYAFTESPEMSLDIEPVFSSRALTYSIVTNIIQTKVREAVDQSLVMPFMDNVAFYDTSDELFRAGIWDKKLRANLGIMSEPLGGQNPIPPPLPVRSSDPGEGKQSSTDSAPSINLSKGNSTAISSKSASLSHRSSVKSHNNGQSSTNRSVIETDISNNSEREIRPGSLLNELPTQDSNRSNTLSNAIQERKIKQKVTNSYSMIKQWYNKKVPSSPSNPTTLIEGVENEGDNQKQELVYGAAHPIGTDPTALEVPVSWNSSRKSHSRTLSDSAKKAPYNPPEMISNRRRRQPRGSVASSTSTPTLDTFEISEDNHTVVQDDLNMMVPLSPASPQMFINDKFKSESSDAMHGQIISRKSSGSFNIYTGTADSNGFSFGDDEPSVDTFGLRRSSFGGDSSSIKQFPENIQTAVNAKPTRSELEKVPTTIDEVNEPESHNSISQHNSLHSRRKPPPFPEKHTVDSI